MTAWSGQNVKGQRSAQLSAGPAAAEGLNQWNRGWQALLMDAERSLLVAE
ncbi:hypothetical protein [Acidithiobacillus ferrivorans]|nr:hypothetical protein [Acidithiobacillus ferrivorans]